MIHYLTAALRDAHSNFKSKHYIKVFFLSQRERFFFFKSLGNNEPLTSASLPLSADESLFFFFFNLMPLVLINSWLIIVFTKCLIKLIAIHCISLVFHSDWITASKLCSLRWLISFREKQTWVSCVEVMWYTYALLTNTEIYTLLPTP